jgi:hypothetical protein
MIRKVKSKTSILIILIIGLTLLYSCADRRTKEEVFWDWFADRQKDYYMDSVNTELYNQLSRQLHKVDPGLTFEFSPIHDDGSKELMISAAGIKERFPVVIKLVNKAPTFKKWKIQAFRQRVPDNYDRVNYGNLILSYDDIYFRSEKDGDKIGVEFFIKNYKDNNEYGNAIFLLLDQLLGEYDVETKIGWMENKELNETGKDTLHKFIELRKIIDDSKK